MERGEAHSLLGASLAAEQLGEGISVGDEARRCMMALRLCRSADVGACERSQRNVVRLLAHELIVMMAFEMMW
jgi:hypothetical protein